MITTDEMTAIIVQCTALQDIQGPIEYDTAIVIDSFSFVWLQHVLEQRFGFDLEQPGQEVLETLDSARAVHRYLARISPDHFAAAD